MLDRVMEMGGQILGAIAFLAWAYHALLGLKLGPTYFDLVNQIKRYDSDLYQQLDLSASPFTTSVEQRQINSEAFLAFVNDDSLSPHPQIQKPREKYRILLIQARVRRNAFFYTLGANAAWVLIILILVVTGELH